MTVSKKKSRPSHLEYYFLTITGILYSPRRFFSELPYDMAAARAFWFLVISSAFFTVASLIILLPENIVLVGGTLFLNAVGMCGLAMVIGYGVMLAAMGSRIRFSKIFCIYAICFGMVLHASWIPFFSWITEPIKWWLVFIGLVKGCGFTRMQAVVVTGTSIILMVLLFHWALYMIS